MTPIMNRHLWSIACVAIIGGAACTETVEVAPPVEVRMAVQAGGAPVTLAVNTVVPDRPSVRVTNAAGEPITGARVLFVPTRGRGTVLGGDVLTSPDGIATVDSWRFGTSPGPQELTAGVVNATSGARVTFTGNSVPGATAALAVTPSYASLRVGQTAQLVVNAVDFFNNPTGIAVAASFESQNQSVATVSASGLVTAVAFGATSIIATFQGATASTIIAVGTRPTGTSVVNTPLSGRPYSVAVSPQGTVYAALVDLAEFTRFDLPSATASGSHAMAYSAYDLAFLPDGNTAYAANTPGGFISVIDRASNTVLRTIGSVGEPYRIRPSPDGLYVFVTSSGGTLFRISTLNDAPDVLSLGGPLNGLVMNEARGVLYASNYNGQVFEVSLSTFTLLRTLNVGGFPQGMAVSADGQTLYLANENAGLQVINAAAMSVTSTLANLTGAFDVAITSDGEEIYVSRPLANSVTVLNALTRSVVRSIDGGGPRRMAMHPDGLTLVIANESGWVTFVR